MRVAFEGFELGLISMRFSRILIQNSSSFNSRKVKEEYDVFHV